MLRTNLWTITMQNVSGIKKWNYEKLTLNFAMQSRSHSRSFPGITMSHSRSRNAGMEFPFPFPKIGNGIFPFPFPKVGNEIFHSRSRSQSLGMGWAIPVPVPKWPKVIPAHPCSPLTFQQWTVHKRNENERKGGIPPPHLTESFCDKGYWTLP